MKKTLKQIADELGVSKDKVKYQVKKLPAVCTVKEGGVTYLTEQGEAEIRRLLGTAPEPAAPEPQQQADPMVEVLKATLDTLQAQLAEKDKQIADLTEANKELTATIKAQAQSINADRQGELAGAVRQLMLEEKPRKRWQFWKKGE